MCRSGGGRFAQGFIHGLSCQVFIDSRADVSILSPEMLLISSKKVNVQQLATSDSAVYSIVEQMLLSATEVDLGLIIGEKSVEKQF